MSVAPKILFLLFFITILSCNQEIDFYSSAVKSYNNENYPLARTQFEMVKPDNLNYDSARSYLKKIDSVEKSNYQSFLKKEAEDLQKIKEDPYIQMHSGTYRLEVAFVSSKKYVEIYELKPNGNSVYKFQEIIHGYATTKQRNVGTWSAQQNTITITLGGRSGGIVETYNRASSEKPFRFGKRYLVKLSN